MDDKGQLQAQVKLMKFDTTTKATSILESQATIEATRHQLRLPNSHQPRITLCLCLYLCMMCLWVWWFVSHNPNPG